MSAPNALLEALAQVHAETHLGVVKPHFFAFGGVVRTARWASAVAERRITFDGGQRFQVDPAA